MKYKISIDKPAVKKIKKFSTGVKSKLDEIFDELENDPLLGKLLKEPFKKYGIRTYSFKCKGTDYRVAYYIDKSKQEIYVL